MIKKIINYSVLFYKSLLSFLINFSFNQINKKEKFSYYNNANKNKEDTFIAFIDRASHPINFNYVEYLLYIKLISRKRNTIIIVLPESDIKKIYKKDNIVKSSNDLRFDTILKNLIEVIEDFNPSIFYCSRRIDAIEYFNLPEDSKFPKDAEYEKINYKLFYVSQLNDMIKKKGFRPLIKAPKAQQELIENILSNKYENKKIITISMRMVENDKNGKFRNSDLETWLDVADWIKKSTDFHPIIIPDLKQLATKEDFRGHDIFPLASYNIKLRVALYEKSYTNLSVPCGFSELLFQSKNNYMIFKFGDKRLKGNEANSVEKNSNTYGIKENDQLIHSQNGQKIYWGEETENFDFIKEKIEEDIKNNN